MEIVYDDEQLRRAMTELSGFGTLGREGGLSAERPVLIDRFLEDAVEVDVDAIRDHAGDVVIGAVMEHVEEAGVHSGDSACTIPPSTLSRETIEVIEGYTRAIAQALEVIGLINVQYAVKGNQVFVIEANPRASRTVPFVAKATGVPLVKVAARVMVGATLDELRARGSAQAARRERPHRREGSRDAVQPVPRCRRAARSGDAQHRRGNGHRPHTGARLRRRARSQPASASPRAARCSCRSRTATRRSA